jgi:hypothetical protein
MIKRLLLLFLTAQLTNPLSAAESGKIMKETKSSLGIVSVDLTPEEYKDGKLVFEMRVNTHTVDDLSALDLRKIVILHVGQKEYRPLEVPRLMGHHSQGALVYQIDSMPKKFWITIDGLSQPVKREFKWPN